MAADPRKLSKGREPETKSSWSARISEPPIPSTPTEPKSQPTSAHYQITCKTEKNWWDKTKPFVECAGAILLAIYTGYTIKMYDANRRAAEAAESAAKTAASQLELAERPWVDANIMLDGPFDFNVNGANVHLKIGLRNTGHTPAQSIVISPVLLTGHNGVNAANLREQVCKNSTRISTTWPQLGITLFPNVDFAQQESFGIGKEEIEKGNLSKQFLDGPTILICMAYRPPFDKTVVYHTAYILDLYKVDSAGRLGIIFKIGEDVDKNHLALRLHPDASIHAD
ncbi:MAG TPA: hypothetical protein VFQ43_02345 [Nitrososphaera sp.]|nr:hypothetical protein [Nitrososphaera sp.]